MAVKPNTTIDDIKEYLPLIHMVLIMTVEPGKGGQAFIEETLEKISDLKKYIDENDLDLDIEVDGGINDKTKKQVSSADILVAGNYILSKEDYQEQITKLR